MPYQQQIFETVNKTRWQRFKWAFRVLLFLGALAIGVTIIALKNMNSNEPEISLVNKAIKKVLTKGVPAYRESKIGKEYRGFRKAIDARWEKEKWRRDTVLDLSNSPLFGDSVGIRAAFYVPWDPQSFYSLERNISKINLVIPEWF